MDNSTCPPPPLPEAITKLVVEFLQLFVCATLAKRIVFLLLHTAGAGAAMAGKLCGVCQKTAKKYAKMAACGQAAELLKVGGGGRKARLADVEGIIIIEVETNNYHTLQQAADMAAQKTGAKVSAGAIRRLFSKHGITKHKCAPLPAKADPVEQGKFYGNILSELIAMAKEGMTRLHFMDAPHFVHGGFALLGGAWGKARRFVKTFSGRKRYNVLGALDFASKELMTVCNSTYITSVQVVALLIKISKQCLFAPVYVILDQAAYQDCAFVKAKAEELGIHLVFLPAYSPNLNLAERVWKLVKSELRKKYYGSFDEFKAAINNILHSLPASLKDKMDSLITENIQLYDGIERLNDNSYIITKAIKVA
ncbi:MAG: IS630 family transposase [Eubacteriaceae bacterium]|nr:IS630 family transposase [Eubacteriaceae bacterium]